MLNDFVSVGMIQEIAELINFYFFIVSKTLFLVNPRVGILRTCIFVFKSSQQVVDVFGQWRVKFYGDAASRMKQA
jgi:hypothetical protein